MIFPEASIIAGFSWGIAGNHVLRLMMKYVHAVKTETRQFSVSAK
jgi:hypothetical protein